MTDQQRKRAVLYCRISVTDPGVEKVEMQEARLRKAAEAAGYSVEEVLVDDGISAYSGKFRPAYVALCAGVQAGRFDVLMAVAQDRFARSNEEGEALLLLCKQHGVTWHTLAAGTIDPNSPVQKALASIGNVLGELESAIKSERIRAAQDAKTARGLPKGGRYAFGWKPDLITPEESEAKWVRWATAQVLDGVTLHAITKHLNEAGVATRGQAGTWSVRALKDMLVRPRNAGWLVVNGDRQKYSQITALVSEEDYQHVLAILTDPTRPGHRGPKVRKHMMSGLVLCACGSIMRSTTKSTGRGLYRCVQKAQYPGTLGAHTSIDIRRLDDEVAMNVFDWVVERPEDATEKEHSPRLGALAVELAEVNRKRAVAQELALMPGADLSGVRATLAQLGAEADAITGEMDAERAALAHSNIVAAVRAGWWDSDEPNGQTWDRMRENRRGWIAYWNSLDMDKRRETVRSLFTVVIKAGVRRDEKIDVIWHT